MCGISDKAVIEDRDFAVAVIRRPSMHERFERLRMASMNGTESDEEIEYAFWHSRLQQTGRQSCSEAVLEHLNAEEALKVKCDHDLRALPRRGIT